MGIPVRTPAQDADEDGVMAASKKPTGLTIARNGNKYTFTWKLGEQKYNGGQQLQWHTTPGKWQTITIGTATTTRSVTLTAAGWYPSKTTKLQSITFRVRGKKTTADSWSDWADKTYTLAVPRVPSLTAELTSSNVTRFSWSATDTRPFSGVEWQSMLVRASNTSNGADLSWRSSALGWATSTSASASSYSTRTEDSTMLAQDSYTRWFRIRSRGMRGVSDWRYSRHVYATPYKPKVNSAKATKSGQTTTVTANWTAPSNQAHPIDSVDCEYLIATPAAGMAAPSGQTWSTGATIKDTGGDDGATFVIDDQVGSDECLWVRVVAYHDARTAVSNAYLVRVGALSTPSGLSVTTNDQTAVVTATNNSDVPDSVLAIVYKERACAFCAGRDYRQLCNGHVPGKLRSGGVRCLRLPGLLLLHHGGRCKSLHHQGERNFADYLERRRGAACPDNGHGGTDRHRGRGARVLVLRLDRCEHGGAVVVDEPERMAEHQTAGQL